MKKKILFLSLLLCGIFLIVLVSCNDNTVTETTNRTTTTYTDTDGTKITIEKETFIDNDGTETTIEKETAISTDGTKTITVTNNDGTKTITVIKPDGTETTTVIDPNDTEIEDDSNDKNRYAVTEYFYDITKNEYLQGTAVDINNVKNNQRIFQSELATNYPNLYNVAKEITYDFTADALSGHYRIDTSTYLYPTSFQYQSTGKIEYYFTLGEIYYDSDGDGYTDNKGTGYFIAPIDEFNQKYPNLVNYIQSESIYD